MSGLPEIDMAPERWQQIKEMIRKQYSVEDEGTEDLVVETADGTVKQGEAEFVVFSGPMGKMKLEFQKKPRLEEKKYHYSHQQGTAARVEYKFSEDELVYTLKAFKESDDGEWEEMDSDKISNFR